MNRFTDIVNELTTYFLRRESYRDISSAVSLYQNGAVAATVNYAKCLELAKGTLVHCQLTATAVGSAGNNIYILLPAFLAPATGISTTVTLGTALYLDTGTAQYYGVAAYVATIGGQPAIVMFEAQTNTAQGLGTAPNIAIAVGDVFSVNLLYERA